MNTIEQTSVPSTMLAARLHSIGEPLKIDEIPVPEPREDDVLVEVKACGVVPNMRRVLSNFFGTQTTDKKKFPKLPAIFGLDPVGIVAKVGKHVTGIKVGERVYVNPGRGCGSCRPCRLGQSLDCPVFTFQGYFGRSQEIMDAYPYGGFGQYLTAPASSLVKLSSRVSFQEAARLGYLGTAYSAMKKIGFAPGDVLLINGISGTLGLCAALLGLAMGAQKILGTGRNMDLLDRVRALAPDRIFTYSMLDENHSRSEQNRDPLAAWALSMTGGMGVDRMIDCLPPGAPASTLLRGVQTLRRGGRAVNVGAVVEDVPLNAFWLVANRIGLEGSVWFSTAEGEELVALIDAGLLDLSSFNHRSAPMTAINETLDGMTNNVDGGFANYLIDPSR